MFMPTEKPERSTIPATPDLAGLFKDYKGRAEVSAGEAFDPTPKNIDERAKHWPDLGQGDQGGAVAQEDSRPNRESAD